MSATATGATVPGTIPTAGAAPTVGATPTAGAAPAPAHAPGRGASTRRTMPGLLAAALGLFLAAHGLAHLVGALAMFGVRSGEATDGMETYITYDGLAATIMGVAWCVGFAAMVVAGVVVMLRQRRAVRVLAIATGLSMMVSLSGLPASSAGVVIDAAILVALGGMAAIAVRRARP